MARFPLLLGLGLLFLPGSLWAQGKESIQEITAKLSDPRDEVRASAAYDLADMGSAATSAVPALLKALGDESEAVRRSAAIALNRIGPGAAPAKQALAKALGDESRLVADAAASALGAIGEPAAPVLVEALSSEMRQVRRRAARALGRVQSIPCVPALIQVLEDEDEEEEVVIAAAWALQQIPAAKPRLIRLLRNRSRGARARAYAIKALGEAEAITAIPALAGALEDQDEGVRVGAAWALGRLGEPAVPALVDALDSESESTRLFAAEALGQVSPKTEASVPALVDALGDESGPVRAEAAQTLKETGLQLRRRGIVLWWAIPRAYWRQGAALMLFLVCWYVLATRWPRHRPAGGLRWMAHVALLSSVPAALSIGGLLHAVGAAWAQGFVPRMVLVRVPFSVALSLSIALCCCLVSVGALLWKPAEAGAGTVGGQARGSGNFSNTPGG